MNTIEEFTRSKTSRDDDSEDAFVVTDDFVCVVDGATSQTERLWFGKTGGQMAATAICGAVRRLPADIDASSTIKRLTAAVEGFYRDFDVFDSMAEHPIERATASAVIFSRFHREVWLVGDCQCLMLAGDGQTIPVTNSKRVDEVNAAARALFLEAEIAAGITLDTLLKHDTGRDFIRPLLQRQKQFQNSGTDNEFSYWVIDGFPVDHNAIRITPVPDRITALILASDGYPKLSPTLEETERFLKRVIESDPLLIKDDFKSTKGVMHGSESYDDRTYLKIDISSLP